MKYDFETVPPHAGSLKWHEMEERKPGASSVPLSVADMEFYPAPEIAEAVSRAARGRLGYTGPTDGYFDAVCGWMRSRQGW